MKIEVRSAEFCSTLTLGALLGLSSHASAIRSLRRGRDAYLAHCASLFDRRMAHPPSAFGMIIVSTGLALLIFAVFKGVASAYAALFSATARSPVQQ